MASWGYDILFGFGDTGGDSGLTDVVSVAAGELHACALHADELFLLLGDERLGPAR